MRVVISEQAKQDLREITTYIARDNAERAISFVRELRAAAKEIGLMPRAFSVLAQYTESEVRRRPFRSYLIFYRVKDDTVSS